MQTTAFHAPTGSRHPVKMKMPPFRHARGGGHPGFFRVLWIPAYAGMTA